MKWVQYYHRQSLRTKLVFAFMLTVSIPLVGASLYGNWITSQVLQSRAVEATQADLRLRRLQMEEALRGVEQDLLFLSQMNSMTALLNERTLDNLARVQVDFADFVVTHPSVFQARYLDETGMEVVRIDAGPEGASLVPPPHLQNKADRYYFTHTMTMPLGGVYISPIDLNREFSRIQQPHTPTIRYATPVFAADGRRVGIVILNLYAEPLLQFARGEKLALTDDEGYFLTHPDPALVWGGPSDLNTNVGAFTIYPEAWPQVRQRDVGVITPQPENWGQAVWEFLMPVQSVNDTRRVLAYEVVQGGNNQWHLIVDMPRASLFASVSAFRVTAVFIILWALFIAAMMAVAFSRQLTDPIRRLTADVRQFGQKRGLYLTWRKNSAAPSNNEIETLTFAFYDMSTALDQHMLQLSKLNLAGHHIAARLEKPELLTAVATAIRRLFPVDYFVLTLEGNVLYREGEASWAAYRHERLTQTLMQDALDAGNWTIMALSAATRPSGFVCSAPICVAGRLGLMELYGRAPMLGDNMTGELLATLAVQVSVALENAELVAHLAQRRADLQTLLAQLMNAQEEERRRIAYDIHDGLIQMLVGVRLQLVNFTADRERDVVRATASLQKGIEGLGNSIVEARRIIEGLRPAALDDLGLVATIHYAGEEAAAACGCTLMFTANVPDGRLPPTLETTAFRIMQEAITNARKYAQMTCLSITLKQENARLYVEVRDDGQGFDLDQVVTTREGGFGLRSMQERARLMGGKCTIVSEPGRGTAVQLTLPLPLS